jgi:hypothetical protein
MATYIPYQLYQTLSQNAKSRDITPENKQFILDCIPSLRQDEKEAFFLLIFEHYRLAKKEEIDINNIELPYKIKRTENGTLSINIDKLPTKLRQILLKFIEVIRPKEIEDEPQ